MFKITTHSWSNISRRELQRLLLVFLLLNKVLLARVELLTDCIGAIQTEFVEKVTQEGIS